MNQIVVFWRTSQMPMTLSTQVLSATALSGSYRSEDPIASRRLGRPNWWHRYEAAEHAKPVI